MNEKDLEALTAEATEALKRAGAHEEQETNPIFTNQTYALPTILFKAGIPIPGIQHYADGTQTPFTMQTTTYQTLGGFFAGNFNQAETSSVIAGRSRYFQGELTEIMVPTIAEGSITGWTTKTATGEITFTRSQLPRTDRLFYEQEEGKETGFRINPTQHRGFTRDQGIAHTIEYFGIYTPIPEALLHIQGHWRDTETNAIGNWEVTYNPKQAGKKNKN